MLALVLGKDCTVGGFQNDSASSVPLILHDYVGVAAANRKASGKAGAVRETGDGDFAFAVAHQFCLIGISLRTVIDHSIDLGASNFAGCTKARSRLLRVCPILRASITIFEMQPSIEGKVPLLQFASVLQANISSSFSLGLLMKIIPPTTLTSLFTALLVVLVNAPVQGSIIDSGNISVMTGSGGGFLGGTSTFSVTATEIPDVELLANFLIVDAGVEIVVNGTPLFPQFDDISQFGPVAVFSGTGEPNGGGVNSPFGPNNNGLPRLTVNSTSAGTDFSGATFVGDTQTTVYTPVFAVQDFSSLLVAGNNTIEFFVLNNFSGSNLQGDFTVNLNSAAIPEPGMMGVAVLAMLAGVSVRRRR